MLKATTHRLARLLRSSCAALQGIDGDAIYDLIRTRLGTGYCCGAGEARRLAKKTLRLRDRKAGQSPA
jgi:hypothetical protein